MTKTPRTDAAKFPVYPYKMGGTTHYNEVVTAEFAENLEKQNSDMRDMLRSITEILDLRHYGPETTSELRRMQEDIQELLERMERHSDKDA